MINVGIVGMGVIGRHVADAITKGIPGVALAGVTVRDPARALDHRALGLDGADPGFGPDCRGGDPGCAA
jgi:glyceraldehyde-3-phosphate dehydrogenase/erythrose-4-phosphate dehydrogenase